MWTKAHSSRPLESKSRGSPLRSGRATFVESSMCTSHCAPTAPLGCTFDRNACGAAALIASQSNSARGREGYRERRNEPALVRRLRGCAFGWKAGRGGRCAALKRTVMPAVVLSRLVQRTCAAPPSRPRALPRPPPRAHTHARTIRARTRTAMSTASEHDQGGTAGRAHSRALTHCHDGAGTRRRGPGRSATPPCPQAGATRRSARCTA